MATSDSINAWVTQKPRLPKNVVASKFYAKYSRNGHLTWLEKSLRHFQVNAEQLSYKISCIREGGMHIVCMRDICATIAIFFIKYLFSMQCCLAHNAVRNTDFNTSLSSSVKGMDCYCLSTWLCKKANLMDLKRIYRERRKRNWLQLITPTRTICSKALDTTTQFS